MKNEQLNFRSFITPKIVGLCWGMAVIGGFLFLAASFMQVTGLRLNHPWVMAPTLSIFDFCVRIVTTTLALLGIRIWLEFLAIIFSIYDRLIDICDLLGRQPNKHSLPPLPSLPRTTHALYRGQ